MAGDIRDSAPPVPPAAPAADMSPATGSAPDAAKKSYEAFQSPPASANSLPACYGMNTAGAHGAGHPKLLDAARTVRLGDFAQVHMYPCARDSLLTGMAGAFVTGGVRGVLGASPLRICNWAVGAFCFAGIASYEYCLFRRRIELTSMKRVVEVMDKKKMEKEAMVRRKRMEDAKMSDKEQEASRRKAAEKSTWKFW